MLTDAAGDIRSRLIRLIPHAPESSPLDAIRHLLAYRLPSQCTEREARDEWRDIVEGRSPLWTGIPNDRKEAIRGMVGSNARVVCDNDNMNVIGFLVYFESELLKRAHKNFDFRNGRSVNSSWSIIDPLISYGSVILTLNFHIASVTTFWPLRKGSSGPFLLLYFCSPLSRTARFF